MMTTTTLSTADLKDFTRYLTDFMQGNTSSLKAWSTSHDMADDLVISLANTLFNIEANENFVGYEQLIIDAIQDDLTQLEKTAWVDEHIEWARKQTYPEAKFYVEVEIAKYIYDDVKQKQKLKVFDENLDKDYPSSDISNDRKDEPHPLFSVLKEQEGLVVILGDPGYGKTTSMNEYFNRLVDEKDPLLHERVVPMLISLTGTKNAPLDLMCKYTKPTLDLKKRDIENVADKYVLIFDGLDTMDHKENSPDIFLRDVRSLMSVIACRQVVITCKTSNWLFDLLLQEDEHVYQIQPFSRKQIKKLIKARIGFDNIPISITIEPRVMDMARIPQLLTFMCELLEKSPNTSLPENRCDLISNWIIKRLDEKHHVDSKGCWYLNCGGGNVLGRVAYSMMVQDTLIVDRNIGSSESNMDLSIQDGRDCLELAKEAGILAASSRNRVQFIHQTIQEYFAAYHLSQQSKSDAIKMTLNHVYDRNWNEVLRLLGSLLGGQTQLKPQQYIAALLRKNRDDFCIRPLLLCLWIIRDIKHSYVGSHITDRIANMEDFEWISCISCAHNVAYFIIGLCLNQFQSNYDGIISSDTEYFKKKHMILSSINRSLNHTNQLSYNTMCSFYASVTLMNMMDAGKDVWLKGSVTSNYESVEDSILRSFNHEDCIPVLFDKLNRKRCCFDFAIVITNLSILNRMVISWESAPDFIKVRLEKLANALDELAENVEIYTPPSYGLLNGDKKESSKYMNFLDLPIINMFQSL